jgi:hypothetical protein
MIQIDEHVRNKQQMLTIPQLAAMGLLPGRAIRRLVAEGRIPCVRVGNRQYICLEVFERFLQDGYKAEKENASLN